MLFGHVISERPPPGCRVGRVFNEKSFQGDLETVVMRSGQGHVVPDVPEILDVRDVIWVNVADDVKQNDVT